jgi:hypothetical protein
MSSMKILIIIASLVALSKADVNCDAMGRFKCKDGQTCCRIKGDMFYESDGWKWVCFFGEKLTCCSDGLHVCPANSQCIPNEKKCIPKPSMFLEREREQKAYSDFIEALESRSEEESFDRFYSYFN